MGTAKMVTGGKTVDAKVDAVAPARKRRESPSFTMTGNDWLVVLDALHANGSADKRLREWLASELLRQVGIVPDFKMSVTIEVLEGHALHCKSVADRLGLTGSVSLPA